VALVRGERELVRSELVLGELSSDEPVRQRLERQLAARASRERAVRLAVLHAIAAERADAEASVEQARGEVEGAWHDGRVSDEAVNVAAALVALLAGDGTRGLIEAERAPGNLDALAIAGSCLELLERGDDALARVSELVGHPLARIVRAKVALSRGQADLALEELGGPDPEGLLGATSRRVRAEALLTRDRDGDVQRARDELSRAVWKLVRLGAPAELGRSYMAMAQLEQARGGSRDNAAQWLARAHPLLERAGVPRDEARLRRAFRKFGRRAIDRLVDDDLERVIEGSREVRARAGDLARAVPRAASDPHRRDLEAGLERALGELGERDEELVSALEGALLEKERTGRLVEVCRELLLLRTSDEIVAALPRLAIELGHEAASVVRDDERAELLASQGEALVLAPEDRDAASRAPGPHVLPGPGQRVVAVRVGVRASSLLLAMRRAGTRGVRTRGEIERIGIFASVATAALERAAVEAVLREAALRDATTLEAIRDGIVRLDAEGRVRAMNAAAAAILGVSREAIEGRVLDDVPGLGPLAEALSRAADEQTVHLPRTDVLVRSRSYEGGRVATVQELDRARQLAQRLVGSEAAFTFEGFVGRDAAFLEVLADARRIARADVPVLVTGESGTGKELLAQAIHNASPRAQHPFVGVNVAAIPRELLESELFGYEAGAFTGARAKGHPGRFELAGQGTILLDEIGDMPLEMQTKLLRVLQERSITRLAGTRPVALRARVIATTHRDLEQAVRDGTFRLDLFYRLRVVHLRLPPLRARAGDVRVLAQHYLALFASRAGRGPIAVDPAVLGDFERYAWPGNVRELANLLEGVASLLPADRASITETPAPIRRALASVLPPPPSTSSWPAPLPSLPPVPSLRRSDVPRAKDARVEPLAEVEKRVVTHALRANAGNVAAAARALGIARNTLYAMVDRHALRAEVVGHAARTKRKASG
jgi:transcriptional regulator with PAS, ATPase and Fis domain